MKNLVIVESPAKCKTIEKYLGSDYKVVSSKGHIRDLATTGKFGLGVDINNDFKPNYEIIKGKTKDVNNLKKEVNAAETVYLATDPDREGETISWHIFDEIKIPEEKYKRVVFNEITKDVVLNSINNPGKIDMNLVKSGETRRILDRIIGFRLSKLMQRKTGGKSAGRVQSVALKLIVDREREIQAFVPREYWTIEADFKDFKAVLDKYHGKEIEIPNEVSANEILDSLSKSFKIESVEEKEKKKFDKLSVIFTIEFITIIICSYPLLKFLKIWGMVIWIILFSITMITALKIEKVKKQYDIQTYKEILAFCSNTTLSRDDKNKELGKRPYQKIFLALGSGLITLLMMTIFHLLFSS